MIEKEASGSKTLWMNNLLEKYFSIPLPFNSKSIINLPFERMFTFQ